MVSVEYRFRQCTDLIAKGFTMPQAPEANGECNQADKSRWNQFRSGQRTTVRTQSHGCEEEGDYPHRCGAKQRAETQSDQLCDGHDSIFGPLPQRQNLGTALPETGLPALMGKREDSDL